MQSLLQRGKKIHLLSSSGKKPLSSGKNVQLFHANILDGEPKKFTKFLEGCDLLFHLAGMVSRKPEEGAEMMRLHVEGTRNILKAAAETGIPRVILVSTSGVVGISKNTKPASDNSPYAMELALRWPYYASKIFQEKLAKSWAEEHDRELIAIRPSLALGPGDRDLSSTQDIFNLMKGRVAAIPHGGLSFVDVRDISNACLAASELSSRELQKEHFRSYLLGAANMNFRQFTSEVAKLSGASAPRFSPSPKIQQIGAHLFSLTGSVGRKWIELDATSVEMANFFWYIDSSRAKRELNWKPRPIEETLGDTIHYLQKIEVVS